MTTASVTELPGEHVTLFTIREGWEWGNIFVRPVAGGAEVVAHSTFGTYGHTWVAMGGDWREFLSSCSREYAMRKLAGQSYDVPLDRDEFAAAMRSEVDDYEKGVLDSWGILDPDQERRIKFCRDALDDEWAWEDVPQQALFWHFNQRACGAPYAMELYETRLTKINPQVAGFWETIWTPFMGALLAQGIEAATADETGTGSVHESAVGNAEAPNPDKDQPHDQ
jgi:hypothetical protein